MKFLVDAHLPPALCDLLHRLGHEAVHTSRLPAGNDTTDSALNQLSLQDRSVVVSKDRDFYHSHLLHGKPFKLLLVRTGNIATDELLLLLERHFEPIEAALRDNSLIEISREGMNVVA